MTDEQNRQVMQAIKELQDQMKTGFAAIDKRFEQVDSRLEAIDQRLDKMDDRFDRLDDKTDKLKDGLDLLAHRTWDNEQEIYRLKIGKE
ncbi:hypothetical protein SAMN05216238_101361 [Lentibacillus persicus]|uniref:t-SNARE coiled-coil homology domain-containing protein n=1 Tax=Lentibacillus persicus TaxID=640948 RepID=A0A1I1SMK9_9BACI|nr:hypothetical protein [Lentibacillus persicus]SFD44260.1 hypothetical protein SAMN05216238_101361 [Lentibacillus persicus]